MIDKIRAAADRRRSGEEGFTLIELLVVIIILVALAAVALPVFLNQKAKGDNAATQTVVSNLANAISGGIGTGSLSPTSDGSAAVTGNITTEAGTQAIPSNAAVWYNSSTGAFCVSATQGGATAKYTSAAPTVVTGGAACTSPTG